MQLWGDLGYDSIRSIIFCEPWSSSIEKWLTFHEEHHSLIIRIDFYFRKLLLLQRSPCSESQVLSHWIPLSTLFWFSISDTVLSLLKTGRAYASEYHSSGIAIVLKFSPSGLYWVMTLRDSAANCVSCQDI